jgi:hypothetical protein
MQYPQMMLEPMNTGITATRLKTRKKNVIDANVKGGFYKKSQDSRIPKMSIICEIASANQKKVQWNALF